MVRKVKIGSNGYAYSKHHARVFIMFILALFFSGLCTILTQFVWDYFFGIIIDSSYMNLGLAMMLFLLWSTNVRFGFVENIIFGRKLYPQFSVWFAPVNGW